MKIFSPIRNKIEDIKSNTVWFDKRFSLRFKIANTLLHDELRLLLAFTHSEINSVKFSNRTYDEHDNEIISDKAVEFFADRAIKYINEIFEL